LKINKTEKTVYLEHHMLFTNTKKMMAARNNR